MKLSQSLLFELAPPLDGEKRRTARDVLRSLLSGYPPRLHLASHRRALVLCAVLYRVAAVGLQDAGCTAALPRERAWRRDVRSAAVRVPAARLVWTSADGGVYQPFPSMARYMAELRVGLVRDVIAWAPPVVVHEATSDTWRVVADAVPAVLARTRLANEQVDVRQLATESSTLPRTLIEALQLSAYAFRALFDRYQQDIAVASTELSEAVQLTGFRRAWAARLRQGT